MKLKFRFSYIMLIVALAVASCAGYFSVWGLSQLFAGASTAVIIMASILEIAKVVTTTALHKYWNQVSTRLKIYLTTGVTILMIITSAGIYGFLSNAYQRTADKLEIHEGNVNILDSKKLIFEKNISDNEKIITTKNKRIDQLTNLRSNQENRLDSAKTNRGKDKVRTDISIATNEIQKLSNDIDGLNTKNAILSDSVSKYNVKVLELKAGSDVAAEVGPLKYIAELTGAPMGKIVNYLILLVIFVFDPLAIALILMTNRIFQLQELEKNDLSIKKEEEVIEGENTDVVYEVDDHTNDEIDIVSEEEIKDINEGVNEGVISEPEVIDKPVIIRKEPVITTGKVELENIKEIKESNRGYSVKVPQPKTNNTIERVGSNKIIKNGDNNELIFKRK